MREHRIYIDGKLVNICHNEYALMCNVTSYRARAGKDKVEVKTFEEVTNDEEKEKWLANL